MARIKVELPAQFSFTTSIPVRITDLNYGGHVGNDTVLSIIHEARVQFLGHHGFKELDMAGAGLIMSDVVIEFKLEAFYGDVILASVTAGDFSKAGFDLFYLLEKETPTGKKVVAVAKTGMVCFNYATKKVMAIPEEARVKLSN